MPDPEAFIMAEEEAVGVGGADNNHVIQLQPQHMVEELNDTTIAAAQEEEEEPVSKCAKEATEEEEAENSKFCTDDAVAEVAEAVAEAVAHETIDAVAATPFHHSEEAKEMVVEAAAATTTTEPQNTALTQAPAASAEDEADNDCSTNEQPPQQPPDSNNTTTTPTTMQPQHPLSHMSIVERERDALRQANAALRREIAQRDTLEEQMENELNQLSKVVEQQWHKICHLEAALTKERAIRDRTQASLVKAKHQHKELRKNIKKRKRAAFAAMAEAHESDLIATTLHPPIGDLESPATQEGVGAHSETEPAAQHTGQEGDAEGDMNQGEPGQSKKTKTSKHHNHPLIGQTWDGRDSKHDLKWMHMLEELKRFKQEFGHVNVPAKWKGSDPRWNKLACWCSTQRTQHKLLRLGKWTNLKPERVRQLQALGFKWNGQHNPNTIAMSFDDRVLQLQDYKQTHGDCNVPQKYEDLPGLGNFVLQQRKYYRLGTLSAERIQILERIGFQWSLRNRGGSLEARMMKHSQSNTTTTNTMDPTYGLPEPEMVEQPQHHEGGVNDAHDVLDPHPHHAHHHPLPHEEDEPPHHATAGVTATTTEEDPVPHHPHPAAPHQWTDMMHALPRFPQQPLWTTEAPPVSPPRMAPPQQPWMATTTTATAPDYAPYNMYNG